MEWKVVESSGIIQLNSQSSDFSNNRTNKNNITVTRQEIKKKFQRCFHETFQLATKKRDRMSTPAEEYKFHTSIYFIIYIFFFFYLFLVLEDLVTERKYTIKGRANSQHK